jgi:hypothetical protein
MFVSGRIYTSENVLMDVELFKGCRQPLGFCLVFVLVVVVFVVFVRKVCCNLVHRP